MYQMLYRFLCLFVLATMAPLAAAQSADQEATSQREVSPEQQQMNVLTQRAMEAALTAISKSGGVYPFGVISDGAEDVTTITRDLREEDGAADKWFKHLSWQMRKKLKEKKSLKVAALVRMHKVKDKSGNQVPGIWVLTDHRNSKPVISFLPLIKQENGKHRQGEVLYQATQQRLFPQAESQ